MKVIDSGNKINLSEQLPHGTSVILMANEDCTICNVDFTKDQELFTQFGLWLAIKDNRRNIKPTGEKKVKIIAHKIKKEDPATGEDISFYKYYEANKSASLDDVEKKLKELENKLSQKKEVPKVMPEAEPKEDSPKVNPKEDAKPVSRSRKPSKKED